MTTIDEKQVRLAIEEANRREREEGITAADLIKAVVTVVLAVGMMILWVIEN